MSFTASALAVNRRPGSVSRPATLSVVGLSADPDPGLSTLCTFADGRPRGPEGSPRRQGNRAGRRVGILRALSGCKAGYSHFVFAGALALASSSIAAADEFSSQGRPSQARGALRGTGGASLSDPQAPRGGAGIPPSPGTTDKEGALRPQVTAGRGAIGRAKTDPGSRPATIFGGGAFPGALDALEGAGSWGAGLSISFEGAADRKAADAVSLPEDLLAPLGGDRGRGEAPSNDPFRPARRARGFGLQAGTGPGDPTPLGAAGGRAGSPAAASIEVEKQEGALFRALGFAGYAAKAGDCVSTEISLASGNFEQNPLMRSRGARIAGAVALPVAINWGTAEIHRAGHPRLAIWARVAFVALHGYATLHNLREASR